MKRFITILLFVLYACSISAFAQMSDDQVISYAKTALEQGRDQKQIAKELLARGVSNDQAERIKNRIESSQMSGATATVERNVSNRTASSITLDEHTNAVAADILPDKDDQRLAIFGRNIFNTRNLSFEPNENVATPDNYKLGPGDEIIVEIWGYNEARFSNVISPEGRITISQVGPIQLNGLTIEEASKKIKRLLSSKYAGLGDSQSSSVSVTLGRIRTIQVNIMGEVTTPGTYRLSSFATVFHALYRANGVTTAGTLREIKVIRSGKEVASVDVYDYIFEGTTNTDINLQDGDIIIVPTYVSHVQIEGKVKRPMVYELTEEENFQNLLEYCGGFASDAYDQSIKVVRNTGIEKEIFTIEADKFDDLTVEDGDIVTVGTTYDRFANKVEIRGYVFRPDVYELGEKIHSVKSLVEMAQGPKEDAFLERALLLREKEDLSVITIAVDLGSILNGTKEDIKLQKNDILIVSGIYELNSRGTLSINGLVYNPSTFVFTDNTTIEDLIIRAGGLLEGASMVKVEVARRVYDPMSLEVSDTLSVVHTVSIENGFAIDGGDKFILEPYDVVSVRRTPGFENPRYVTVGGAVNFPGQYVLLYQGETISDIIKRAGGLTKQADIMGARLKREGTGDNISSQVSAVVRKNSLRDSTDVDIQRIETSYLVALNLDEALANPKSYSDVQLVEGDFVHIPEMDNTVKVLGEVMFPVAVSFAKGKGLRYYVNAAGGYSERAKRSKAYVVYPNGSASKATWGNVDIRPGSIIIIPTKPEPKPMQIGEIAAITSASTSLVSLIALVSNLLMK